MNRHQISQVKIMRLLLMLIFTQLSFASYASKAQNERATGTELQMLPELCQARFKNGLAGKEYQKWKTILGRDHLNVHHYCDGLTFLNRASRYDKYHTFYLGSAYSNFQYTIKHLINPDYVLLPDIYYQLSVVEKKRKKFDEAISYAKKSIKFKKKYIKPYLILADIYIDHGNKGQAKETLFEAKKYYPKSKAIKRRLKRLKDN